MKPCRYALIAVAVVAAGCTGEPLDRPAGGGAGQPGDHDGGADRSGGGGSGGSGMGGMILPPDPNDPLYKMVACSSGRTWSGVNGETMYPGDRCQGCHIWEISGTIYPTGHEQTLCNGQDGTGITVVVSDAVGRVINLTPNSVGNFYYQGTISYPFTAKVVRGSAVRAMLTPQNNAECNACHTPDGILGAPGRIVPPL
jgi:hypothetical protein